MCILFKINCSWLLPCTTLQWKHLQNNLTVSHWQKSHSKTYRTAINIFLLVMKVTVFQIRNGWSPQFLFIYLFRNYNFWLYLFLFSNEAECHWIKWQCFVDSNKAELLQENEHSSSQSLENSLNEIEMYPDDPVFSATAPVKWFRMWTNRFSCFFSIKGPVFPPVLPQGSKGTYTI